MAREKDAQSYSGLQEAEAVTSGKASLPCGGRHSHGRAMDLPDLVAALKPLHGKATWATDDGGVSKVKEFLRLTVEIDAGDGWGPHGQKIGQFDDSNSNDTDFLVDYVKVWQNENYEQYIKDDNEFSGSVDLS